MGGQLEGIAEETLQNDDDTKPDNSLLPYVLIRGNRQELEKARRPAHRSHQANFDNNCFNESEHKAVAEVREDEVGLESG